MKNVLLELCLWLTAILCIPILIVAFVIVQVVALFDE